MTHYISVLRLDVSACRQLNITDGYSLHRVVYGLFDDIRSDEQKQSSVISGIQWVDKGGDARGRRVLILSNRPPKEPNVGELETRTLPEGFLSSHHYRFTVCLNPTRRDRGTHKLIPILGRDAIGAWFCQRASGWGFHVDPLQVQVDAIKVMRFDAGAQKNVTLQQATLSGRLTVVDLRLFKRSFMSGIGRGRAFGCGLLQIVPLPETVFFD
ncbi:type I-E CRISPR-associated protein Cas6/Cse3/CasE [Entomohabitans teleogrylli]|uniref:type I-E CRISPR-associated protein Cas6/Cse3/CasE n=1 Tax=Entomohabitans teleogrylli TaxID=1384589 RepID=UPI00073DAF27|nr:type I-E CRISPR-associated protein Cas6/Cse3/CasE [Entomohabitans teleogrylli]